MFNDKVRNFLALLRKTPKEPKQKQNLEEQNKYSPFDMKERLQDHDNLLHLKNLHFNHNGYQGIDFKCRPPVEMNVVQQNWIKIFRQQVESKQVLLMKIGSESVWKTKLFFKIVAFKSGKIYKAVSSQVTNPPPTPALEKLNSHQEGNRQFQLWINRHNEFHRSKCTPRQNTSTTSNYIDSSGRSVPKAFKQLANIFTHSWEDMIEARKEDLDNMHQLAGKNLPKTPILEWPITNVEWVRQCLKCLEYNENMFESSTGIDWKYHLVQKILRYKAEHYSHEAIERGCDIPRCDFNKAYLIKNISNLFRSVKLLSSR